MKKERLRFEKVEGRERFSRRMQNDVEILERETVRTVKLNHDRNQKERMRPRLIIEGALSRSRFVISKSRAQLGEVDSLLRSLIKRPIGQGPAR